MTLNRSGLHIYLVGQNEAARVGGAIEHSGFSPIKLLGNVVFVFMQFWEG